MQCWLQVNESAVSKFPDTEIAMAAAACDTKLNFQSMEVWHSHIYIAQYNCCT